MFLMATHLGDINVQVYGRVADARAFTLENLAHVIYQVDDMGGQGYEKLQRAAMLPHKGGCERAAVATLTQCSPSDCVCLFPNLTLFEVKVCAPPFDVFKWQIKVDLSYCHVIPKVLEQA